MSKLPAFAVLIVLFGSVVAAAGNTVPSLSVKVRESKPAIQMDLLGCASARPDDMKDHIAMVERLYNLTSQVLRGESAARKYRDSSGFALIKLGIDGKEILGCDKVDGIYTWDQSRYTAFASGATSDNLQKARDAVRACSGNDATDSLDELGLLASLRVGIVRTNNTCSWDQKRFEAICGAAVGKAFGNVDVYMYAQLTSTWGVRENRKPGLVLEVLALGIRTKGTAYQFDKALFEERIARYLVFSLALNTLTKKAGPANDGGTALDITMDGKPLNSLLDVVLLTATLNYQRVIGNMLKPYGIEVHELLKDSPSATPPGAPSEPSPAVARSSGLLPPYTVELSGSNEVRIKNPNGFSVKAGIRSGGKGKDLDVPADGVESVFIPDGKYDIYLVYSNKKDALFQGDTFTLSGNGVEIQIVKVVGGNYGIRQVK